MRKLGMCLIVCSLVLVGASSGMAEKDVKVLYEQCAGCHGKDGTVLALGKGAILKGQSEETLLKKLNGYVDGTFGGSQKGIMTSIMKRISEEDRKRLAKYISEF